MLLHARRPKIYDPLSIIRDGLAAVSVTQLLYITLRRSVPTFVFVKIAPETTSATLIGSGEFTLSADRRR